MTTNENRMRWLLKQIVDSLPQNRDWLDPDLEREARDFGRESTTSGQITVK